MLPLGMGKKHGLAVCCFYEQGVFFAVCGYAVSFCGGLFVESSRGRGKMQDIGMDLADFKHGHGQLFKKEFSVGFDFAVFFAAVVGNASERIGLVMVFALEKAMHVFYAAEPKRNNIVKHTQSLEKPLKILFANRKNFLYNSLLTNFISEFNIRKGAGMRDIQVLKEALENIVKAKSWEWPEKAVVELPKDAKHGDLATNIAMTLAKVCQKAPRAIAEEICAELIKNPLIENVEIAGPGFINVTFKQSFWHEQVLLMESLKDSFGSLTYGKNRKVNVEYVSANPTGPLHIGHGRGAAVGDSMARILRFAGYDVSTEYYINDAGLQMRLLGLSTWLRMQDLCNMPVIYPEDYYKGEYIIDIAKEMLKEDPELPQRSDAEYRCFKYAMQSIMDGIKKDLEDFRVEHQVWFSESSLVNTGVVEKTLRSLKEKGYVYEQDDALWFKSTLFGDDKDRVLRKRDGFLTYFASDIAYHADKINRGFDEMIDVWGADHHGYVPRMAAAIETLGKNPKDDFTVILIQLVNLLRGGEPVAMSTRSGEFITLREVVDEVGVDAARFMFLSRKSDQPLDFDLDLVKQRNLENPVYYVQYAHARIKTLLRRAAENGHMLPETSSLDVLAELTDSADIGLIRAALHFEEAVLDAAKAKAVHIISFYLMDLAGKFHSYYANTPVLSGDEKAVQARLALLRVVGTVLRSGMNLLGVEAPETM